MANCPACGRKINWMSGRADVHEQIYCYKCGKKVTWRCANCGAEQKGRPFWNDGESKKSFCSLGCEEEYKRFLKNPPPEKSRGDALWQQIQNGQVPNEVIQRLEFVRSGMKICPCCGSQNVERSRSTLTAIREDGNILSPILFIWDGIKQRPQTYAWRCNNCGFRFASPRKD